MTLFEFAFKNVSRDKRNYIYYFINCVFSVFVFFLFSVLSFHPALKIIDTHSTMGMILALGEVISVIFSICFIAYSMKCFLKARSQQLGLITILGACKKQLNRLIFIENMLIGLLSIVIGIILGLIFSKFFLDIANQMIGVSDFVFYFPVQAMIVTTIVMGMVFWGIAYFTPKFIRKKEVVKLLKAEMKDDKPQNLFILTILFIIFTPFLIWSFFGKSDLGEWIQQSFFFPFLIVIVVTLGTYLIFSYGIRVWIKYQQKSDPNTRLLSIGDQRSKLKTNVQSMTISTILYAISFFSVIVLFSISSSVKSQTEKILPYALTYNTWTEQANVAHDLSIIEQELQHFSGYQKVEVQLWYPNVDSRNPIMSQSNYNEVMNALGRDSISLTDQGIYLVAGNINAPLHTIPNTVKDILQKNHLLLSVEGQSDAVITLAGLTSGICVVNDAVFQTLMPQLFKKTIIGFTYDGWQMNAESPLYLRTALQEAISKREINLVFAYDYYRSSQIQSNLGLYIGAMLSFVFILAVASFIYSRLYSELEIECKKFKGIVKIGLSKKELSAVLKRFTFLILCVPFGVALAYLWIGIFITNHFTLVSNIPVAMLFTLILLILQTVVYLCIKTSYQRTIFDKVYG